MKMITSFDPSSAPNGTLDHKVSNPCGGVYLFNESNVWLQLRLPGGKNVGLPAWWARFYQLSEVLEPIQWQELATISTVSTPLSQVFGEAYESSELKSRSFYDGPIPRNPYIGNQVNTMSGTSNVQNDGNPITTIFIEATQQGNTGGSNVAIGNDGSFDFAQWVSSAFSKYFYGVPGATPVVVLGQKTVLQALDNSGDNLSNVFGIDSSGNTFVQNHATGKKLVGYNHTGSQIWQFDDSGDLTVTKILLTTNSIKRIAKFTGSADQVITHNWGEQADLVLPYYNGSFGTAPTQALAVKNEGTSSFEVVGQSGYSWSVCAIKF